MGWTCYSCGTENSKEDALCKNCGNTVAAPKSFYAHWIVGAAIFFMVFYMAGTMAGGVMIEAIVYPDEPTIIAEANRLRIDNYEAPSQLILFEYNRELKDDNKRAKDVKDLSSEALAKATKIVVAREIKEMKAKPITKMTELKPEQVTAAKAVAVAKKKAEMNSVARGGLQWILPMVLFVICGAIVGFISDGVTIVEAGIGSVIGQAIGVALMVYVFSSEATSWLAFGIGAVPGAGLAVLGAWLGEKIQLKKEQAGGITS